MLELPINTCLSLQCNLDQTSGSLQGLEICTLSGLKWLVVADYGDKDLDWGLIILINYTGQTSVHYLIFSTIKLFTGWSLTRLGQLH